MYPQLDSLLLDIARLKVISVSMALSSRDEVSLCSLLYGQVY